MNIILPIISNIILVAIMSLIVIVGVKSGVKPTLLQLAFILISAVSSYFISYALTPVLVNLLEISASILFNLIYFTAMLIAFFIVLIVLNLIKEIIKAIIHKKKGNTIKSTKLKGIDRSATKELRKQEKELKKLNKTKISTVSKVFGGIFAFIISIIVTCMIMLPIKYGSNLVVEINEDKAYISSVYEYTAQGQIDNLLSDIIEVDNNIEGE